MGCLGIPEVAPEDLRSAWMRTAELSLLTVDDLEAWVVPELRPELLRVA